MDNIVDRKGFESMEQNKDEIVIDLREIFGILKHNIVSVLTVTVLFLIVAGYYIYTTPNMYESKAIICVLPDKNYSIFDEGVRSRYDELLKTKAVITNSLVDLRGKGIVADELQIAKKVKVIRRRNSNFIDVVAQDPLPERACAVAQAVAENGVKYVISCIADTLNSEIAVYNAKIQSNRSDNLLGVVYADMVKLEAEKEALVTNIKVIEKATLNSVPVAPRKVRIMAVAFILGIICGSMYVVLKEKL